MTAADILADGFPHGTVLGYDEGCRTNHCPAPIVCHVFRTRYVGDWAFRRRVDAGMTAAQIVEQEAAEVAAAKAARATKRATVEVSQDWQRWSQVDRESLARMYSQGMHVVDIATALGRTVAAVKNARTAMGLTRTGPARTVVVTASGAMVRRGWSQDDIRKLRELNAAGMSDPQIAAELDRTWQSVAEKRRALRIEGNQRPVTVTHGTLQGYTRFKCKDDTCPATPSCGDIGRAYYRQQWQKRQARKENAA
jgi:hypothetical protein